MGEEVCIGVGRNLGDGVGIRVGEYVGDTVGGDGVGIRVGEYVGDEVVPVRGFFAVGLTGRTTTGTGATVGK